MKHNLRFLIPFIPIIGIPIILTGTPDSWFNKDKYGNYSSVFGNLFSFFISAVFQAITVCVILYLITN